MTQELRPVSVITGASAGLGAALAHEFAAHGHEVVLVARREQALSAVADAIAAKGSARPTVLRLDVARVDAARDLTEALARRGLEPDIIVNNAGFGLLGSADKLDRAAQLAMIDLNVRALTDLSLAFIASLERRRGGILNVASTAGFLPAPVWPSITPPKPMWSRSVKRCINIVGNNTDCNNYNNNLSALCADQGYGHGCNCGRPHHSTQRRLRIVLAWAAAVPMCIPSQQDKATHRAQRQQRYRC